jgi:O-antigen/teichoic acid export membrane protein
MPGNQLLSELWEHKIIKYAIPYIPWTFLIWFQQVSDRWALDFYIGPQAVGIYAVTFQLGFSSILMLFSVAIRFIQPIIYQQASIKNPIGKSKAVDIYNHSLLAVGSLIGSMIFIISMIFHKQFFSILVAYEYQEYSYLLPWMVVSAVLFGISEILLLKMQSDMRTVKLSTVKCFLGLLGIILSVLGAAYGGLEGVTLALVLFCIVNLLIMAISSYA